MRRHKYRPGPAVREPLAVIAMMMGGAWFYWHGVPKSPVVMLNMSGSTLISAARNGGLKLAIPNEEPKP